MPPLAQIRRALHKKAAAGVMRERLRQSKGEGHTFPDERPPPLFGMVRAFALRVGWPPDGGVVTKGLDTGIGAYLKAFGVLWGQHLKGTFPPVVLIEVITGLVAYSLAHSPHPTDAIRAQASGWGWAVVAIPAAWVIISGIIAATYQPWRSERVALNEALRDRPLLKGGIVQVNDNTVPWADTEHWWIMWVAVENLGSDSRTKGWSVSVIAKDGSPLKCGAPTGRYGSFFQTVPKTKFYNLVEITTQALVRGPLYNVYFHFTVDADSDQVDRSSFVAACYDIEDQAVEFRIAS